MNAVASPTQRSFPPSIFGINFGTNQEMSLNRLWSSKIFFANFGPCGTHLPQGCQMVYLQIKIPILVHFGGPLNGRGWYILWLFVLF
jgi:hypothetical protein